MTIYVALLRAINVGGTGKLAMSELVRLCEEAGMKRPKTYIQSGNVVFESALSEAKVKAKLAAALAVQLGKPAGVLLRTGPELDALLADNPFPRENPARVLIHFLDQEPARGVLAGVSAPGGEQLKLRGRDLYVYYPNGQGTSKLKLPFAKVATARNLNTVAKLAELARAAQR
jgi:uncharacterized protein (DUF1697 family)